MLGGSAVGLVAGHRVWRLVPGVWTRPRVLPRLGRGMNSGLMRHRTVDYKERTR
jgi:hypothetical protein